VIYLEWLHGITYDLVRVDFLTQLCGRFGSASDLRLGIARFGS